MTDTAKAPRLLSLDRARGLAMALMALDHTRDFWGDHSIRPTDLSRASALLFFTRWVTHFCAPTFVLLAGTSAYLHGRRLTGAELSRFLVTRGLWLVFLELTVVRAGWSLAVHMPRVTLQVIWALGWSMVALAALRALPRWAIALFGAVVCVGHNALDGVHFSSSLWAIAHESRRFSLGPLRVFVLYPLIPWVGLMALGYALGPVFERPLGEQRRALALMGVACLVAFVALRVPNVYGDPTPWSPVARTGFSILATINTAKYPPSLAYLLMTVGPLLLLLSWWTHERATVGDRLVQFGRVPLFFYVIHLPMLQVSAGLYLIARGGVAAIESAIRSGRGTGLSLPMVYAVWLLVLVVLYPACRWFAALKARRRDWWLSYL